MYSVRRIYSILNLNLLLLGVFESTLNFSFDQGIYTSFSDHYLTTMTYFGCKIFPNRVPVSTFPLYWYIQWLLIGIIDLIVHHLSRARLNFFVLANEGHLRKVNGLVWSSARLLRHWNCTLATLPIRLILTHHFYFICVFQKFVHCFYYYSLVLLVSGISSVSINISMYTKCFHLLQTLFRHVTPIHFTLSNTKKDSIYLYQPLTFLIYRLVI